MPTDVSARRLDALKSQFEFVSEQITRSHFPFEPTVVDRLVREIRDSLERARDREENFADVVSQGGQPQLQRDFYQRFVTQLDFAEQYLERLQQTITFAELHQYQRGRSEGRLEHTAQLCQELDQALRVDTDIIPVIWDVYAILPILERDLHVLWVPRAETHVQNGPVIAHEVGHVLLEQMEKTPPMPFRERLADLADRFPDAQQEAVIYTWNQWFNELFCDACGFFTFGPAYLLSLIHRIQQSDPYHFPDQIGPDSEFHPPDALRYSYVSELAQRYLPQDLYDQTEGARKGYQQHLDRLVNERPPFYDDWVNEELLQLVTDAAIEHESDLDQLIERLTGSGSSDSDSDPLRHRVQSNEFWFERIQNGGY